MTDRLRLLLIEDDRVDEIAFRRMVEADQHPYDFTITRSATDASSILAQQTFDIVLADLNLSDGTAFDVMGCVSETPVVFMTGAGSETIAVEAMKSGAADYITKDHEGRYLELLPVVVNNVIKRQLAEREARELFRERIHRETLEDFIRDASHDLRTPLATLKTSLYLLRRFGDQLDALTAEPNIDVQAVREVSAKLQDRATRADEQSDALVRIINEMMEMVKIDNLSALQMSRQDLNRLVMPIVFSYKPRSELKSQTLRYVPVETPLLFQVNVEQFSSIVRNLLKNAIDYTPIGGTIDVSTEVTEEEVCLTVADTGIGIPADELPNIFRRFYRVNNARSTEGTGLGLAIVQRLVDLHGGRIKVESKENEGTMFQVFFPRSRDESGTALSEKATHFT